MKKVIEDAIHLTAYPSTDTVTAYFRRVLSAQADNHENPLYAKRFAEDLDFGNRVAPLLNARLSGFRGNLKKIACSKVEGFYHLVEGPECRAKVEKLIQSYTYIYPTNEGRGLIIRTKPFNHPAIISILREFFFGGTRKTLAEQHRNCFTSTLETRSDEPEIPAAALALVVTCIHSAIDDYSSGVCKKTEFNADLYEDVYKSHIEVLEHIKTTSAAKYHRLMTDLYNNASAVSIRRTAVADNVLTLLDLDNMED